MLKLETVFRVRTYANRQEHESRQVRWYHSRNRSHQKQRTFSCSLRHFPSHSLWRSHSSFSSQSFPFLFAQPTVVTNISIPSKSFILQTRLCFRPVPPLRSLWRRLSALAAKLGAITISTNLPSHCVVFDAASSAHHPSARTHKDARALLLWQQVCETGEYDGFSKKDDTDDGCGRSDTSSLSSYSTFTPESL